MDNQLVLPAANNLWSQMVLQLNIQAKKQAMLQEQLESTTKKLKETQQALERKEQIIDSLAVDLEHVISQIGNNIHWMSRPVPGLNN